MTLVCTLFRCMWTPFLQVIPYRLLLIVFKYSQPILIKQAIRYVSGGQRVGIGTQVAIATPIIYVGLAVSVIRVQEIVALTS